MEDSVDEHVEYVKCEDVKLNEDYVYYENLDDMIEKIDYYLANPAKRNEIARSGQQKVFSEHTYEQRFQEILDIIQKG